MDMNRRIDTLGWIIITFTLLAAIAMFFISQEVAADGNIGFTYSQVIDDQSGGVTAEYEHEGEIIDFEIDGQLQAGDIYRCQAHAEVVFRLGSIGLKPFVDVTAKGYTLDGLGREQNYGLAGTVKVGDLDVDMGVGGRNSNPWGEPNALDELLPKGYNEDELKALGLEKVHPTPKGIPFKSGNSVIAFASTSFEKGNFSIDLKGVFEVAGEGDKAHQIHANFETHRNMIGNVDLIVGLQVATQFYQKSIQYESALLTTIGYRW